jgi:hypothetical protein
LNKHQNSPTDDQLTTQEERREIVVPPVRQKEQFIEPVVSVPVDVLESTSFFQSPTIDTSDV